LNLTIKEGIGQRKNITKNEIMKGVIVTIGEVSTKTKKKLKKMMAERNERLERMAEDYRTGKIRFSK